MQPTTNKPLNRNDELHTLLLDATGIEPAWTSDARANPFGWLSLASPDQLKNVAQTLAGKARLCTVTAYAEERDDDIERRRIAYHFASGDTVITVTVPLYAPGSQDPLPVPSITPWFRNADWNEREFAEMFNIQIVGHPNMRRLFLDERLDAGIMSKLIPFSAMAHGAASNTLWEQVLEAKGVPLEERLPSLAVPAEPIKVEPSFTPVSATEPKPMPERPGTVTTLVDAAVPAEEVSLSLTPEREELAPAPAKEAPAPAVDAPAPAKEAPAAPANNETPATRADASPDATPATQATPPAVESVPPAVESVPPAETKTVTEEQPAAAQAVVEQAKPATAPVAAAAAPVAAAATAPAAAAAAAAPKTAAKPAPKAAAKAAPKAAMKSAPKMNKKPAGKAKK